MLKAGSIEALIRSLQPRLTNLASCILDCVQVVIRVRPPLPRELQGFTEYQCTSMVDARSGQLITISENLPAVLSGQGASDGMLYATYRCAWYWDCLGHSLALATVQLWRSCNEPADDQCACRLCVTANSS